MQPFLLILSDKDLDAAVTHPTAKVVFAISFQDKALEKLGMPC
jgi:hypothetical protein